MQPTRMHTILMIGNRNNKQEQVRRGHDQRSMIIPSVSKIIHEEAFDKVFEVLNTVHHERRTDWDVRVPAVLWAYKKM